MVPPFLDSADPPANHIFLPGRLSRQEKYKQRADGGDNLSAMSRATRESGRAKHHAKHGTNPPDDIQNPAATGDAMPTSSSPTMSKRGKERRISSNLSSQMKRVVDNSSSAAAATERRRASDASPQQHRRRDVARRASTSAAVGPPSGVGFSGSFDDSRYWDYAFRQTQRQDIGNQCRECKRPFLSLNEEIAVRRYERVFCQQRPGLPYESRLLLVYVLSLGTS